MKNIKGKKIIKIKLEKYKEKNSKKIGIIVFTIVCVFLIAGVFFYTSFAAFESRETYNLMEGNVKSPGDIYFAYYIDGVASDSFPRQNTEYTLDASSSTCTNGVVPSWDYATWSFLGDYSNYQPSNNTATRCNLYFVKNKTVSTALGELSVYPYTPDFTKSACDDAECESHEKGIYAMTLDDGSTTYYYRGSVENNYLRFAGYWWRVIRINEDGSIRIIYDGTTSHENGESSTDRYYSTSSYAIYCDYNEYVGYMYTVGEHRGFETSSAVKQANDKFYEEHLSQYEEYIDTESGFCNDRSTLNLQTGVGVRAVTTYYKGYLRAVTSSPDLNCENADDLFTVSSSSKGNKALTYPIGLITMDEALLSGYGGGVFDGQTSLQKLAPDTYLTIGNLFSTMTPVGGYNSYGSEFWAANVFDVNATGKIDEHAANQERAFRPTINLKANVTISGEGTISDPYIVS